MKVAVTFALVFAVLATTSNSTAVKHEGSNPVSQVVSLLQALAEKIEKDGKTEEGLYEDYVCWGKTVISEKTASNAAAESKITELEAYISNVKNGAIELTSEREDLEKEISEVSEEIESATQIRNQEHSEFLKAEKELKQAIQALDASIKVLEEATTGNKSALMSTRSQVNAGIAALIAESADLNRAVELGKGFLSKADSFFLSHLLSGQMPVVDWKKLNRKATFKMKYKARSTKIQDVLARMLGQFKLSLEDAQIKENSAAESFRKLMLVKKTQLTNAQDSLILLEKEAAAAQEALKESETLLKSLQEQVTLDTGYIKQTESDLAEKKTQWKSRSELRAGEIAAINKAIEILHNDDTRDVMDKSFKSQGYSFLQRSASSSAMLWNRAHVTLRRTALLTGDRRVLALVANATDLDTKGAMGKVITMIDELIADLKKEEETDLKKKEECEATRAADTRSAVVDSRTIDEMSDTITGLEGEIEALNKDIEETSLAFNETNKSLAEATKTRDEEHEEFLVDDADDAKAFEAVKKAKAVLEKFYKDNDLMFMQKAPGEAPTAPPATWEGGYMGAVGESTGILAVMDMVMEDITKDKDKAQAAEDAALKAYNEFKADSERLMKEYTARIDSMKKDISDRETSIEQTKKQRGTKKDTLDSTIKKIKETAGSVGGCDYFTTRYVVRRENRYREIDGLQKGKDILQGGKFDAPDPTREIKPGDALLHIATVKSHLRR